jgi:hypothetical protein
MNCDNLKIAHMLLICIPDFNNSNIIFKFNVHTLLGYDKKKTITTFY